MRVVFNSSEKKFPSCVEVGQVLQNTKGGTYIVSSVSEHHVQLLTFNPEKTAVDKLHSYSREYVERSVQSGKWPLIGRAEIPEIKVYLF